MTKRFQNRLLGVGVVVLLSASYGGTGAAAGTTPRQESGGGVTGTLVMPTVSFSKLVIEGWTKEINLGKVVMIGHCWPDEPRTEKMPCRTSWIAGHHTTHGSPMRKLPQVKVGAKVSLLHDGKKYTYRIVTKKSVPRSAPPSSVFDYDLMLQCSDGSKRAWVLNGTLLSVT